MFLLALYVGIVRFRRFQLNLLLRDDIALGRFVDGLQTVLTQGYFRHGVLRPVGSSGSIQKHAKRSNAFKWEAAFALTH
jgi:hypothetical protein